MAFVKATKKKVKLKLAITGPGGSGKTMSALRLAHGMGGKVALIDTENESASLYSDRYGFDVNNIKPPFTNEKFIEALKEAVDGGYDTVIIDSASHIWEGILDFKSKMDARGGNSYTNWNEAGKKFKDVLDAVLQSPVHVICCMRSKQEYVLETNDRGKQVPRKVGLAPIMRDGIEYEFTTVFDVDMNHNAKTSKDRTGLFSDNIFQINEETGKQLTAWMDAGAQPAVADPPTIGGSNPDIARPVSAKWSDDQKTEAGGYRAELAKFPGGDKAFSDLWAKMKQDPPSVVIDALATKLREFQDINQEGAK
jgi:hypothetical protein